MMSSIINKTVNYAIASLSGKPDDLFDANSFLQAVENLKCSSSQVCKFLDQLKKHFGDVSTDQQHKYLVCIIYCTNLANQDGAIRDCLSKLGAVIVTYIEQAKTVGSKKLGYLALTTVLSSTSRELVYLAVNTILKDVTSKYIENILLSLDAICHLVIVDLVPVLLPVIEQRLKHQNPAVRIKAFRALCCVYKVGQEFVKDTKKHVKLALSDQNPQVMASALHYVHDVVKNDSNSYDDLAPVLVAILKQIVQGKLPVHMSVQGIPAPFEQILLLKILHQLSITDETRAVFSDVLLDMMNRLQAAGQQLQLISQGSATSASIAHIYTFVMSSVNELCCLIFSRNSKVLESSKKNLAYAVLTDCIHTALTLYQNDEVTFNLAIQCLSRFLNSSQPNLLITGMNLLTQVAKIKPSHCVQYQSVVLACLSNPDATIKRQTLVLLQALVNKENYKVIIKHVITMLNSFNDPHFTKTLGDSISEIAEKFSSDTAWLLRTLHTIMEKCGDNVSSTVAQRLINQVSKAKTEDLLTEVEDCIRLLEGNLSYFHFEIIALMIAKCFRDVSKKPTNVLQAVVDQSKKQLSIENVSEPRQAEILFVLLSFAKQVACDFQNTDFAEVVIELARMYSPTSPVVYQSLCELEFLCKNEKILKAVSTINFEFDDDFSFLDHDEVDLDDVADDEPAEAKLKSLPYSFNKQPVVKTSRAFMASVLSQNASGVSQTSPSVMGESFLSKKAVDEGAAVWSVEGYQRPQANMSLNQALRNLPNVAVETTEQDKAMLEIVNDVFATSLIENDSND